jgi:hypothetical protein
VAKAVPSRSADPIKVAPPRSGKVLQRSRNRFDSQMALDGDGPRAAATIAPSTGATAERRGGPLHSLVRHVRLSKALQGHRSRSVSCPDRVAWAPRRG